MPSALTSPRRHQGGASSMTKLDWPSNSVWRQSTGSHIACTQKRKRQGGRVV